jgi:hypothetical protein
MTALLDRCRALGIHLWLEADRLRYDAPRGALDAELRAELVAHKRELVALLATTPGAAPAEAAAPITDPAAEPPATSTPDPYARLVGPYRSPWGTLVWSDPDAPELEAFVNAIPLPAFEDLLDRRKLNGHLGPAPPRAQRRAHQEELWTSLGPGEGGGFHG